MSDAFSFCYEHEERIAELEAMVLELEGMLYDAQEESHKVSQETIWDIEELIKLALQVQKDLNALV